MRILLVFSFIFILNDSLCLAHMQGCDHYRNEHRIDQEVHGCRSCPAISRSAEENCPEKGFECDEEWELKTNILYPDECTCNEIKCADRKAKLAVQGSIEEKVRCKDHQWVLKSNSSVQADSAVCAKGCDIGVCKPMNKHAPEGEYSPLDVNRASAATKCSTAVCANGYVSLKPDGSLETTFASSPYISCGSDGKWRGDDGTPHEFVMCVNGPGPKSCEAITGDWGMAECNSYFQLNGYPYTCGTPGSASETSYACGTGYTPAVFAPLVPQGGVFESITCDTATGEWLYELNGTPISQSDMEESDYGEGPYKYGCAMRSQ